MFAKIGLIFLVVVFTLLSGFCDSRGFLYASDIWDDGKLVIDKLAKSGAGFAFGIIFYWIVLRFLKELNIGLSTEIQTLGWFGVTMISIAVTSGDFVKWLPIDRFVGIIVLLGIGWLLFRGY